MSKAFTKDDAWEEPVVPPRAPLPDGVPNYVTPRGLTLLRAELVQLEAERQQIDGEHNSPARSEARLSVIPAQAGIHPDGSGSILMDPRLRGDDGLRTCPAL